MESSAIPRVRVARWRAAAVTSLVILTLAAPAFAAEPPGMSALRQARVAWEKGSLDTAEQFYREALEKGGLSPNDVLEGYVRLGSVRASLGKKDQAIAAYRAASILDSTFAVPSEAGPKGPAFAAQAKRDTQKIGSIQLSLKAPRETPSGKPFTVTALLDAPHVPIVAKLALTARDGTSGKEASLEAKPGESVDLEVASDVTLPNASIVIRIDALDSHNNRLATAEDRVKVPDSGPAAGVAVVGGGAGGSAVSLATAPSPSGDTSIRKGGSFWSSPWPYLIGGVALAGAGAAVYFGTRPPDEVNVGQVGVRTR